MFLNVIDLEDNQTSWCTISPLSAVKTLPHCALLFGSVVSLAVFISTLRSPHCLCLGFHHWGFFDGLILCPHVVWRQILAFVPIISSFFEDMPNLILHLLHRSQRGLWEMMPCCSVEQKKIRCNHLLQLYSISYLCFAP